MNHENAVRFTVTFGSLKADELDELMLVVARELGGNTFDSATIEAERI